VEKTAVALAAAFLTLVFVSLAAIVATAQPSPAVVADSFLFSSPASSPPKVTVQPVAEAAQAPSSGAAPAPSQSAAPCRPAPAGLNSSAASVPTAPSEPPAKSVFETPVLGEFVRVASSNEVLATGNAFFCSSGRLSDCGMRVENDTRLEGNSTVFYPFEGIQIDWFETGCAADADDNYLLESHNLSGLAACASNATDVLGVFSCASDYSWNNNVTCAGSASAFKIAFCSSPLANGSQPFKLFKAFVESGFNAHRFILFENGNGFYSLDPAWCPPGPRDFMEKCILASSHDFYSSPEAKNYRGKVKKIDRII
jgi:hypothetical protein